MTANGYTSVKFPAADKMPSLMSPPPGWTNPNGQLLATQAEIKALNKDMGNVVDAKEKSDGSFVIDTKEDVYTQWETDLKKMTSPSQKDSLLWVALHELGHLLGFRSVVDDVDAGLLKRDEFKPRPLDVFRFKDGQKINFLETRRILEPTKDVSHVWADPCVSRILSLALAADPSSRTGFPSRADCRSPSSLAV